MVGQAVGRDTGKKEGPAPEGPSRSDLNMLKVVDKPAKGKVKTEYELQSEERVAAQWLDAEVQKAQKGITSQVVELTPALARVLLQRNQHNRSISPSYVSNYSRDVAAGAWRLNGEPIILSKDGSLNDGQHRAEAVALVDRPITVMLVIGVERDTRTTLDQGRMRLTSDYLHMEGRNDTKALAAAAVNVWQWQHIGRLSRSGADRPTKGEVMALIEATPNIAHAVAAIPKIGANVVGGRGVLAFARFAFAAVANKQDADAFIYSLMNGENLMAGSPILYARNRLLSNGQRLLIGERAELLFRAWNFHRKDEEVRSINLQGGELPLLEA